MLVFGKVYDLIAPKPTVAGDCNGSMAEVAWFSTLSHKGADNKEKVYVIPFGY